MNGSPAVEVTVGADRIARVALAALCAAASASAAAWVTSIVQASPAVVALAACGSALLGAFGGARWQPAVVHLRWDGRQWSLLTVGGATPVPGRVAVAVDLDRWLLLRFDGAAGRRWLPLSRATHASRWHALRCVLYARRRDADPLAAGRV